VFASGSAVFDVFVMVVFGVLGYLMRKFGYEPAPLVLAFVLGPMLENNLRKSLICRTATSPSSWRSRFPRCAWDWLWRVLAAPLLPALARRRAVSLPTSPDPKPRAWRPGSCPRPRPCLLSGSRPP
jgi:putative tricarboxylic transport membrane protein